MSLSFCLNSADHLKILLWKNKLSDICMYQPEWFLCCGRLHSSMGSIGQYSLSWFTLSLHKPSALKMHIQGCRTWESTSPASEMVSPSILPQDNEQTDNCDGQKKGRETSRILSQSHLPAVAHGLLWYGLAEGAWSSTGPSPWGWLLFLFSRC